jgi:hypothetical protein
MDTLPTELLQNIVEFCDGIKTVKSLRITSSEISQIVNHNIQRKLPNENKSFKLMQIIDNIRKLELPIFRQSCYHLSKVLLRENVFLYLGQNDNKIVISTKHPNSNLCSNFLVLLDNTKFFLDKCHYIPIKEQLIIHTFSLRSSHSDTYHSEIIVKLWPEIIIEEYCVKTRSVKWKQFPFCYKCYFALPNINVCELPLSDKYQIVKRTKNDVWYTKNKKANLRSIKIFSFEEQTCVTLASTERKNFKFIRVIKFFDDFMIVGIWKRSSHRCYELYHLMSPTNIRKYEIRYKKGGMGMIDSLISINLTKMQLEFMSNNNIRYSTQLVLSNQEPRVQTRS